jgi:hypothetical protein
MFKWIVKNIYGANLFGKRLIGHLISTLYTTLEPKKKKVKSLMVAVLRKVMLNGRYHEIIVGESSRFRCSAVMCISHIYACIVYNFCELLIEYVSALTVCIILILSVYCSFKLLHFHSVCSRVNFFLDI